MWAILCFLVVALSNAAVSPNPFLRPGFNQKPVPSNQPLVNPRPIPQKDMSQEIEFRGYFLLKGQPFFCLFNKKSQHGEWVGLSEITYEEFTAQEFDLDSETLTVIYEGKSYDLPLLQSKSSTAPNPPNASKQKTNKAGLPIPSRSSPAVSQTPRYMPPKPTQTPTLPPWLAQRRKEALSNNPISSSSRQGSRVGGGYIGSVPRRTLPGLPPSGSFDEPLPAQPISNSPGSVVSRVSPTSSITNGNSAPVSSERTNFEILPSTAETNDDSTQLFNETSGFEGDSRTTSTSNDFDLENLPPPPPPPNILPPSPPPNILPSREE